MSVRVAYGKRANMESSIANGKIPPGAFIVTEEQGELYFYDTSGKLQEIISKEWVEEIRKAEEDRKRQENKRITSENARNIWEIWTSKKKYIEGNKVSHHGSSYLCLEDCQGIPPTIDTFNMDEETTKLTRMISDYVYGISMGNSTAADVAAELGTVFPQLQFVDSTGALFANAPALQAEMEKVVPSCGDTAMMNQTDWKVEMTWREMQYSLKTGLCVTEESGKIPSDIVKPGETGNIINKWLLIAEKGDAPEISHLELWETYGSEKEYVPGNKVSYHGSSYVCIKPCQGILPVGFTLAEADAFVANLTHTASANYPATVSIIEPLLTDTAINALNLRKSDGTTVFTPADKTALAQLVVDAEDGAWNGPSDLQDSTNGFIELTWKEFQYYILNNKFQSDSAIADFEWNPNTPDGYWLLIASRGDKGETGAVGPTGATGATGAKGEKGDMPDVSALYVWEPYDPEKEYVIGNKVSFQGSSWVCKVPCKNKVPSESQSRDPFDADAFVAKLTRKASEICNRTANLATPAEIIPSITDEAMGALRLRKSDGKTELTVDEKALLAQYVIDAENDTWGSAIETQVTNANSEIELSWKQLQSYILHRANGLKMESAITDVTWKPDNILPAPWLLIAACVSSQTLSSTLLASAWTGNGPYRQTVNTPGLESVFGGNAHGILSVASNANDAAWNAAALGRIQVDGQTGDTLTVTAARSCPTVDIPVTILIVG